MKLYTKPVEALAVLIWPGSPNLRPDAALLTVLASVGVFHIIGNVGRIVRHVHAVNGTAYSIGDRVRASICARVAPSS